MSAPFKAQAYNRVVLLQTAAEWAETTDRILQDYETGRESDTGFEKTGDGVNTWNDLTYGPPALAGLTAGSVPYAGPGGQARQDNDYFFYDVSNHTLKLGDKDYNVATSGWNGGSFLQIGNNLAPVTLGNNGSAYGAKIDFYTTSPSGFTQTSGIRVRGNVSGSGGSPTVTGVESFVTNTGSSATTDVLQGLEGVAQVSQNANIATGGWFFANAVSGGSGTTITELTAVRATTSTFNQFTVTNQAAFYGVIGASNGPVTNMYGLRFSGWTGSAVTNSYGIYMDTSIDRGATLKYAIYSLSTSPSLLTGELVLGNKLTMTEITAPAAPAANGGVLFLEDNGAGKTRLMVQFATGAPQQVAIEP